MSFRPSYYGGFPGPPESHYNQPRIQEQRRGFTPPQYVQPLQDVTYYPDPTAPSFYPSAFTPPFNGSQIYTPEYGLPPNYPMHYPPEYYFEQQPYSPIPSTSPTLSTPQSAVETPVQFNQAPVPSQNLASSNLSPPKPMASHENSAAGSSGKSRRFSHQRNVKEAAASGSSGEMFVPFNQNPNKEKGRSKKILRKHSIRFSHQREMPQSNKGENNEMDQPGNAGFEDSSVEEDSSQRGKSKATKTKENDKKRAHVIPPDNRNQATVLEDQLSYGSYECMVCCDRIRPQHAVWNCHNCYNLFHMGCIKKWARSPAAKYEESGWRCPGCQHVTKNVPNTYYCFCGKFRDPEYRRGEITPHSCGDVCGRNRKSNPDCTHPCNILCHPGPCPQCPAMINKPCKCGKVTSRIRCSQQRNFMCENRCAKMLNCTLHECEDICHDGECKRCSDELQQACHCKRSSRKVTCGSEEHIQSVVEGEGSYSCGKVCKHKLECGRHHCHQVCHLGPCKSCSLLPAAVILCPCTQTKLADMKNEDGSLIERSSCADPVPTCGKKCGKPLRCGGDDVHMCKLPCHTGDCPPCADAVSNAKCRCGKSEKDLPCKEFAKLRNYICERRCYKKKKCGKHKCRNSCCVDKQHDCTQTCGRRLTCGGHYCNERCHRGACHTCYNVSFDELHCHCGVEVLFPPIACGTKPPECSRECTRMHTCTHPVRHTCHSEATCPPCVELVKKQCNCGRVMRSNIMCHIENVSCGERCAKTIPCGHKCLKICHIGPCSEEGDKCKQPCSIIRADCVHPCAAPCHSGQPCPNTSCRAMVTLRCSCGRREQAVKCSEGGSIVQSVNSAISSSKEAVDIHKLLRPGTTNLKTLHCDEECAVLARNKRFAEALDIETEDYSSTIKQRYSEFLIYFAKSEPSFISSVEKDLISLVENVKWLANTKHTHSFPPMKRDKRQVVHELAEAFHCKSDSHDHEPKRNVVVTAEKEVCRQPTPLLSVAVMEKVTSSQKRVSPKPARKGLLSSMKLVSYSSAEKSRDNGVRAKQAFQQKQTPFTPSAPYKPPHRASTLSSSSNSAVKGPPAGGAMEQLSRKYGSMSVDPSKKATSAESSTKKEGRSSKDIDYFDMTD